MNYPLDKLKSNIGLVYWLSCNGYLLVELFFEISGVLFVFAYEEKIKEGLLDFSEFVFRRVLKIYPMMIISTIVMTCLEYIYFEMSGQWWLSPADVWHILISILGVPVGWFENSLSINMPIWYISILFQCYIIGWLLVRLRKRWNLGKSFYIIPVLFALGIDYVKPESIQFLWFNGYTSRGFSAFFSAVFLAVYIKEYEREIIANKNRVLGIAYGILLLLGICIYRYGEGILGNTRYVLVFLIYPCILVIALLSSLWKKVASIKLFQFFGNISFEIYLWNLPTQLLTFICMLVLGVVFPYDTIKFFLIHMLISIFIAFIMYKFLEIPLGSRLQRKWNKKKE